MKYETKEWLSKKVTNAILLTGLAAVLSVPALMYSCYRSVTTHDVKRYRVHIDAIDTTRALGFATMHYGVHMSGDTTGIFYQIETNPFAIGKDYEFNIRRYGLIGEHSMEDIREIEIKK